LSEPAQRHGRSYYLDQGKASGVQWGPALQGASPGLAQRLARLLGHTGQVQQRKLQQTPLDPSPDGNAPQWAAAKPVDIGGLHTSFIAARQPQPARKTPFFRSTGACANRALAQGSLPQQQQQTTPNKNENPSAFALPPEYPPVAIGDCRKPPRTYSRANRGFAAPTFRWVPLPPWR